MKRMRALHFSIFCLGLSSAAIGGPEQVEVMHWWTSAGEIAAVAKLKDALKARGFQWKDVAVGGNENAKLLLKTRFTKGNAPAAAQINDDIKAYSADLSRLADLTEIAKNGHWDDVLPPIVQRYAKADGTHYTAVPVNVHRTNMMWLSASVLKQLGGAAPTTWEEFFSLADKAKKMGTIPVAVAEDWTISFLFDQIAFSAMGAEQYKAAFYNLDDKVLRGSEMTRTFELFRRVKAYTDKGAFSRKWNEATYMVITGKALLQVMGDWAKGEFTVANLKANQDFYCTPLPGSGTGHLFVTDAFIFFKVRGQQTAGQSALADVLMRKDVQEAFNLIKGSVPVRLDADMTKFDDCGKQSHADFVSAAGRGTLVASPAHFQPTRRWNAWRDVALAFWSDDTMTPQQAADKMAAAAKL